MTSVEMAAELDMPPGSSEVLADLVRLTAKGRLPHALLFVGPRGVGKFRVAQAFVEDVLVSGLNTDDRQKISALLAAGTHPDFMQVMPEPGKAAISVDQIRNLGERLSLTPHFGKYKLAVISPAESMTISASNALLKTLEEPPGDSLILLLTSNKGRLSQTIRSRCQQFTFRPPKTDEASDWLADKLGQDAGTYLSMARGTPFLAMGYHEQEQTAVYETLLNGLSDILGNKADPLSLASHSRDIPMQELVSWIEYLVLALIRQKMMGQSLSDSFTNCMNHLKISVDSLDLAKLFHYRDFLRRAESELDANLNRDLFLEEVFMRWSTLKSPQ